MKNVIIYTSPTCHFCHMAKDFFDANRISYIEKDVSRDRDAANEAREKSGEMAVPVIDMDGEIIIGFDKRAIEKSLGL